MPWDMNDYPSSWKNFEKSVRKKAIEIGNAMLDEGYSEGRAIPIATEKAKEWHENASSEEVEDFLEEGNTQKRSEEGKKYEDRPELMERAELVTPHDNGWAVQAKGAKKPSEVFSDKTEAVKRAKEIAENKGTEAVIKKEDGSIEDRFSYGRNE